MKKLFSYCFIILFLFPFYSCKKEKNNVWHYNDLSHWHWNKKEKMDEAPHEFITKNGYKACSICPYQTSYTNEENYQVFLNSKANTLFYEGDYFYDHFYQSDTYQEEVLEMFDMNGKFYRQESIFEFYQGNYIEVSQNIDALIHHNDLWIYFKITRFLNEKMEWEEIKNEENVDLSFIYQLKQYSPKSLFNEPEAEYIEGQSFEEYQSFLTKTVANSNFLSLTPFSSREEDNTVLVGYKKREKNNKNLEEIFTLYCNEAYIFQTSYQSHYLNEKAVELSNVFSFSSSISYHFDEEIYTEKMKNYF